MSDDEAMPALPVLVVAAVCIEGDRVLLTQRPSGTHLAGKWEFPGGKMEPGEAPDEALVREMREECGVVVEVGEALDVTYWRYPRKSVLLLFYRARIVEGAVQHVSVAGHVWATADALDGYDLPPADARIVARVKALLTAAQ